MTTHKNKSRKIAIIGCGFSGTSLAANIHRLSEQPIELILCDKSAQFGVGDAYRTPYAFHLLNVRAHDMSAFEDQSTHFINWLKAEPQSLTFVPNQENLEQQFVPRMLYRIYLQHLLTNITDHAELITTQYVAEDIVDVLPGVDQAMIVTQSGMTHLVDQVVFAIGNNTPTPFPFSISNTKAIANPWDYQAPIQIAPHENVLLVGTGLSMIDTVLTLHQQKHQGNIYALSRHGLLPLPHSDTHATLTMDVTAFPHSLAELMTAIREQSRVYCDAGGDWRAVINTLRPHLRLLWQRLTKKDKQQFLRHVLSYWNVHRHRVHEKIYGLLQTLRAQKQLHILAGRVMDVTNGCATIMRRHSKDREKLQVDWVVNCLGPRMSLRSSLPACGKRLYDKGEITLDPLQLGFATDQVGAIYNQKGVASSIFYSLGSPTKGVNWECTAVPDIRKQSYLLAQYLVKC